MLHPFGSFIVYYAIIRCILAGITFVSLQIEQHLPSLIGSALCPAFQNLCSSIFSKQIEHRPRLRRASSIFLSIVNLFRLWRVADYSAPSGSLYNATSFFKPCRVKAVVVPLEVPAEVINKTLEFIVDWIELFSPLRQNPSLYYVMLTSHHNTSF